MRDLRRPRQEITPIHVVCEELVADPQRVIDRLAQALGIEGPVPVDPSVLLVRVQRDGLNAEWRERFLAAELGVPGFTDIRPEARITFDRRLRKLQRALGLRKA